MLSRTITRVILFLSAAAIPFAAVAQSQGGLPGDTTSLSRAVSQTAVAETSVAMAQPVSVAETSVVAAQPASVAMAQPASMPVALPADMSGEASKKSPTRISRGKPKFDRGIEKRIFVPKGQWITGGNISYSEHTNDNYKFIVLDHWDGQGYTLKVSPFVGYAFANDLAAGGRFEYGRSMLKIDNLDLDLEAIIDGIDISLTDIYQVSHDFTTTGFLRTYINLGESRRFALFNDVRLSCAYGQSKIVNGAGDDLTGTYQTSLALGIGLTPGLVAFINDFVAVEVNVGVLGFNVKWVDQLTDQVERGYRRTSSANFKINLFSIGLGIAFYL